MPILHQERGDRGVRVQPLLPTRTAHRVMALAYNKFQEAFRRLLGVTIAPTRLRRSDDGFRGQQAAGGAHLDRLQRQAGATDRRATPISRVDPDSRHVVRCGRSYGSQFSGGQGSYREKSTITDASIRQNPKNFPEHLKSKARQPEALLPQRLVCFRIMSLVRCSVHVADWH